LSVALDPKISSASFALRMLAIIWRNMTASKASAALRNSGSGLDADWLGAVMGLSNII
jgi:hypothetical protein